MTEVEIEVEIETEVEIGIETDTERNGNTLEATLVQNKREEDNYTCVNRIDKLKIDITIRYKQFSANNSLPDLTRHSH